MSSIPRPCAIVNGARRMNRSRYFWCRRCERSVRIFFTYPYEASCPHCLGQLRHEPGLFRARLVENITRIDRNFLSSLAQTAQNTDFNWRIRREPENGNAQSQINEIIFQFVNPTPLPRITSSNENRTPPVTNLRSILDDDQDSMAVPPPAQAEHELGSDTPAVQSLEKMRLTQAHLENDSHCPICKEEYDVGVNVKMMPCKHFYHPECIDPWLELRNTCPVCRYELPYNDDDHDGGIETIQFDDIRDAMSWTWDRLLSFWPFRLLTNSQYYEFNFEHDTEVNPWWRSWLIL